jgi:hypothetical protein
VLDSFYVDEDGRVANEFYLVSDSSNGEIKKIEGPSIRKLENGKEAQKIFYKYFLCKPALEPETQLKI